MPLFNGIIGDVFA